MEGRVALVTGASGGLGASFARQLATQGLDVVAVGRREERLRDLCRELSERTGVRAFPLAADLTVPGAPAAVFRAATEAMGAIDVLVNNAGAGVHATFIGADLAEQQRLVALGVTTVTELTQLAARAMVARGSGHVLNVGSLGGHLPVPTYATYAAAKAYVRSFSLALAHELAGSGVRVCVASPGGIDTEFFAHAGQTLGWWSRRALMSPDRCARIALRALFRGRREIVPGWLNGFAARMLRVVPVRAATAMVAVVMGVPDGDRRLDVTRRGRCRGSGST